MVMGRTGCRTQFGVLLAGRSVGARLFGKATTLPAAGAPFIHSFVYSTGTCEEPTMHHTLCWELGAVVKEKESTPPLKELTFQCGERQRTCKRMNKITKDQERNRK